MLILKGIIIGIGKIIPGVSGSMLAISMGIYQKLIDSISNFFNDKKSNFMFLIKISIGVIISIVLFSNLILTCLNKFYLMTIFLFMGLIFGGLDDVKRETLNKNNYISIISFSLILILGLLNIDNQVQITNPILIFIFYILVGFVDAVTMVIPGISGTATLMIIGAYDKLMLTFSNLYDLSLLIENIKILFPFMIGLILGIILTVKLVSYLFKKYKSKTYSAILGFSLATIFLMAIKAFTISYTLIELLLAIILFFIGIFLLKKINHYISND